jgi:hypothetical protein
MRSVILASQHGIVLGHTFIWQAIAAFALFSAARSTFEFLRLQATQQG